jgi:hypothetical protein
MWLSTIHTPLDVAISTAGRCTPGTTILLLSIRRLSNFPRNVAAGPVSPTTIVLCASVTSIAFTPPMLPPRTVLLTNCTRRVGSSSEIPEIETAAGVVPCTSTFESITMSVGDTAPLGSKSMHESVLGGVISM